MLDVHPPMRIRISHETLYRYDAPAFGVIQTLRLTPRNYEGQHVLNWRVDLSDDGRREERRREHWVIVPAVFLLSIPISFVSRAAVSMALSTVLRLVAAPWSALMICGRISGSVSASVTSSRTENASVLLPRGRPPGLPD